MSWENTLAGRLMEYELLGSASFLCILVSQTFSLSLSLSLSLLFSLSLYVFSIYVYLPLSHNPTSLVFFQLSPHLSIFSFQPSSQFQQISVLIFFTFVFFSVCLTPSYPSYLSIRHQELMTFILSILKDDVIAGCWQYWICLSSLSPSTLAFHNRQVK